MMHQKSLLSVRVNLMHQSIPAVPSPPPPPGYHGASVHLVSPGGGALANFVMPLARHLPTPGPLLSF